MSEDPATKEGPVLPPVGLAMSRAAVHLALSLPLPAVCPRLCGELSHRSGGCACCERLRTVDSPQDSSRVMRCRRSPLPPTRAAEETRCWSARADA